MRNGLLLSGLAAVLAVAALVISVIALISPPGELDNDYEFHLSDRGEFTVDLVRQALRRYDEEGREATVSYYNSPESASGEWYVFIYDENDQAIAHPNQDLLGQDLKGDLGVDVASLPVRRGDGRVRRAGPVGGLPVPQPRHWQPGVQTRLGRPARRTALRLWLVPGPAQLASGRHQGRPCGAHGGLRGPGRPLLQGPRQSGSGAVLQHTGKRGRGLVCL